MNKANMEIKENFSNEKYKKFEFLENLSRRKSEYLFEYNTATIPQNLGFKEVDLEKHPKFLSSR